MSALRLSKTCIRQVATVVTLMVVYHILQERMIAMSNKKSKLEKPSGSQSDNQNQNNLETELRI